MMYKRVLDEWADGYAISVEHLLERMQAEGIPLSAHIEYSECGTHDFDLTWEEGE